MYNTNSCTVIFDLLCRLNEKLMIFLYLMTEFHRSYIQALFTNFNLVAAVVPIIAKLNAILRAECMNT